MQMQILENSNLRKFSIPSQSYIIEETISTKTADASKTKIKKKASNIVNQLDT